LYANDFAAFRLDNDPFLPADGLYRATGARGVTDVVLYHPDHALAPSEMPLDQWVKIVGLWQDRHRELAPHPDLRYIYIFENTGAAIGVTMPHPHGQIYGFPFIPPLVQREIAAAHEHHAQHGACIYCEILERELQDGRRLVAGNATIAAFVPYFARWPAEITIYSRRHFGSLTDLAGSECEDLAAMIKTVRMKYDRMFGFPMPLMMILRQSPVKGSHPYFHFHVDLYPVQRSATKLKYLAGVESGGGTFLNDTIAEEKARELREIEVAF
jgi:UDPglucose--hexose-1-phosphate uridylyltransferase